MARKKEICSRCGGSGQRFETAPSFFGDSVRVARCGCCGGGGHHWVGDGYTAGCDSFVDYYKK